VSSTILFWFCFSLNEFFPSSAEAGDVLPQLDLERAGADPLSRCTFMTGHKHRTIDSYALKIPAPKRRNFTNGKHLFSVSG
jgi:hypothetical protein